MDKLILFPMILFIIDYPVSLENDFKGGTNN